MTTAIIRRLMPASLALAAMLPLAGAGAHAETLDQLYQKAKAEKELVFYSGGPAAPHENRAKQFMQQFPGISVSVTGGFSNVLNERIEKQMADKKLVVDMAFFQTVQDFVAWKKQGKLILFKPDGFEQIIPNLRDSDGAYMSLAAIAISYAYNTKLVRPEDVPKSALDFLKPAFQGKLISVYPHDDDAALYLFHLIVKKYGWGWMDRYMANKPNFIQGHLPVARSIAEGKMAATLDATITSVGGLKRQGAPVEIAFAAEDETPVFSLTGGIFKDAPHPNAAKLYLTWYLAKEQQARIGTFSPRLDVPPPAGFKPLTSYKIANAYRDFVTDEKLVADLRKRFEAIIGPPVNKGGVR
ncbi:MAG TPA: extracellular solute-binding protein [Alphaproteobacteria bacterium]